MSYLCGRYVHASSSVASNCTLLKHLDDCEFEENGFAAAGGC